MNLLKFVVLHIVITFCLIHTALAADILLDNLKTSLDKQKQYTGEKITIQHGQGNKVLPNNNTAQSYIKSADANVKVELSEHKKATPNFNEIGAMAYKAYSAGQLEASLKLYKNLLEMDEHNADTLYSIGCIYYQYEKFDQAEEYYKKALYVNSNHDKALTNYISLLYKKQPTYALKILKELEELRPNYPPILGNLGTIYANMGDLRTATHYMSMAVSLSMHEPKYMYNLAILYDKAGDYNNAIIAYNKVLELAAEQNTNLPVSSQTISKRINHILTSHALKARAISPAIY